MPLCTATQHESIHIAFWLYEAPSCLTIPRLHQVSVPCREAQPVGLKLPDGDGSKAVGRKMIEETDGSKAVGWKLPDRDGSKAVGRKIIKEADGSKAVGWKLPDRDGSTAVGRKMIKRNGRIKWAIQLATKRYKIQQIWSSIKKQL